jgi:nicotinic acid mononucleotide adenylyltransferase
MLITNLEDHITQGDEHGIFTGTFDPPHIGHTRAITEVFPRMVDMSDVVVIPHNWNRKKTPISLKVRIQWLIETLQEFTPDLKDKIVVCNDLSILENPYELERISSIYRDRIHRIIGSDKKNDKIIVRDTNMVISTERPGNIKISSSIIRDAIHEGRVDDIREMVAKTVLQEILENKCYQ